MRKLPAGHRCCFHAGGSKGPDLDARFGARKAQGLSATVQSHGDLATGSEALAKASTAPSSSGLAVELQVTQTAPATMAENRDELVVQLDLLLLMRHIRFHSAPASQPTKLARAS